MICWVERAERQGALSWTTKIWDAPIFSCLISPTSLAAAGMSCCAEQAYEGPLSLLALEEVKISPINP